MEKIIVRRDSNIQDDQLLELHPVLKKIYRARQVTSMTEVEHALNHLLPFKELLNIDKATHYLYEALQSQARFLIVGDFDADGATSTTLAVLALRALGAKHVSYIVPNRFLFGYGLTPEIVDAAAEWKPDILITVDNGIASHQGVQYAQSKGIKVIITDHHLPSDTLPPAEAIVNPNQPGDIFQSKNLCGVGVIFYVMLALRAYLREQNWFAMQMIPDPNMAQFLDLVALGTVADVVPLDRNNRILVHQGLLRIRKEQCRPGIRVMLELAGRKLSRLVASDLAFVVAPRLNAAGRLEDMKLGIECLLDMDIKSARHKAQKLDELNRERRTIEESMQKQALSEVMRHQLSTDSLPYGVCLFDESWHQGVIGIVAGRIKERINRPVVAFAAVSETELKGSVRSVAGVHIRDLLEAMSRIRPDMITKFGGHAMAAGLSLEKKYLDDFKQLFDIEVRKHLSANDLKGIIYSDGELSGSELSFNLAMVLRDAGPWGQAFPEPLFDNVFRVLSQQLLAGRHLKLMLALEESDKVFDAIAFNINLEQWPNHRCEKLHAAYRLDINEFNGRQNLQLIVEYLQVIA